jgi:nucleoid DNA-binding protein
MANLRKRDLVIRISNETGIVQRAVQTVIDGMLNHLAESLSRGQTIELRNFGRFKVNIRKARVGRNPRRPKQDVPIPPRAVVKFRASEQMKAKVMKLSRPSVRHSPLLEHPERLADRLRQIWQHSDR